MRLLPLLLLAVLSCAACTRSSASSKAAHAAETQKLRVKFKSAFAEPPIDMSEREAANVHAALETERAVVERLRASGYDVVEHGPWDLRMALTIRVHRDDERADATAVFYDHQDRVVDRIALATETKRVPYGVVDGVRDSKKLSSYAEGTRARKAKH